MNPTSHDPDWELIARELCGEATPEDRAQLTRASANDPEHSETVARVADAWRALAVEPNAVADVSALWNRVARSTGFPFHEAAQRQPPEPLSRTRPPRVTPRRARWAWFAYGLGACVGLAAVGMGIRASRSSSSVVTAAAYQDVTTRAGQRASVRLPDGSSVLLGPESRIRYDRAFGRTTRDVWLQGEALFTVVNNAGMPLQVRAGGTITRVLGTTFSVRKYVGDAQVRVTVAQGRVAFGQTVLGTGDIGVADSTSRVAVTRDANVAGLLAWTEGKLVFDKTPLRDALPELERWYGVRVDVATPALLDQRILVTLNTETPREALQVLAFTLGARLVMNDQRATLVSP